MVASQSADEKEPSRGSFIPSDYCYNRLNKGIDFKTRLFESMIDGENKGRYRVLGRDKEYSGPLYWMERSQPIKQVGSWHNNKLSLFVDELPEEIVSRVKASLQADKLELLNTSNKGEKMENRHSPTNNPKPWLPYLKEFKEKFASEWFKDNPASEHYNFFREFLTEENLDALTWEEIRKVGDHLHAFDVLPISRKNAFGDQPHHPVEHYQRVFKYLAFSEDTLEEKVANFTGNEDYKFKYFGPSAQSDILGYIFPNELIIHSSHDGFAINFFNIEIDLTESAGPYEKLSSATEALQPLVHDYKEIVGLQTNLPLYLEIDQFFSCLLENYKDSDVAMDVSPEQVDEIQVDRRYSRFSKLLDLARLILFEISPESHNSNRQVYSLMFDMNIVFERFIAAEMKPIAQELGYTLTAQASGKSLLYQVGKGRKFRLKPDICVYQSKELKFIVDTKWKKLDLSKSHNKVSQADMYQMYAYGKEFQCPRTILLYPRFGDQPNHVSSYRHHDLDEVNDQRMIEVRTVGVSKTLKPTTMGVFRKNLSEMI